MNDAGRIGFVIKGDYSSSATYNFLDVVYYHNATYIARVTTTGILPTDTTKWFCAMNADINGLIHVATVNPEGTEYGSDWLMEDGVVTIPQAEDIYRVVVGGKERLYFWNGTQYEVLSGGGHTVQDSSGTALEQRDNLQFSDMSVEDDSTNNRTLIRQTQVISTQAEWEQMLADDEVDPNITYYLPWMSGDMFSSDKTPIGTVISLTTAKTGEVSGISTPTGSFPNSDYLVCDGAVVNISDYPKLSAWFADVYGSSNYFGGNGTTTIAVPDFSSDFPTNGVLVIKAQMSSQIITFAEVDDELTTDSNVWSADKVNARAVSIEEYIYHMNRRTRRNITSDITADKGAKLIAAVAEQDLAKYGYTIGDYFIGASGQQYNLGDMDCNYGGYNSNAVVSTHHIGIVVDSKRSTPWLSSGSVTNYSSSTLHSFLAGTVMNNVKNDFKAIFGGSTGTEHLLTRTELDNAINGWGTTWTGLANCLIVALTEVQVYGARVFGADGFQTGTGSKHLEIFRKFRFNEIFGNIWLWLKSLQSASLACFADSGGSASNFGVTISSRAVGLILFH